MPTSRPIGALAMALAWASAHAQAPSIHDVQEHATLTASARGTIIGIDAPAHTVTVLPLDQAQALTVRVDTDKVRNFDQLQMGQTVRLDYHRSVAMDLRRAGSAPAGVQGQGQGGRARAGQLPARAKAQVIEVLAPIVAIDPQAHTLAIAGPSGQTQIVTVRNGRYQALLPQLKAGDLVHLRFTESMAVGVEPLSAP